MTIRSGRPRRGSTRILASVMLAGIALGGCRDAADDPLAVLMASETRPALALRAELPALPDLVAHGDEEARFGGALELWESSWEAEPEEALELRSEAYRRAAPRLARTLGPAEARRMLDDLGLALGAVATLDEGALEPWLAVEVARSRSLHGHAEQALGDGDVSQAFRLQMEASDALRAVAPPAVASSLLERAEAGFEGEPGVQLTDTDRERVERLLMGAHRSAEARDWDRAIRRAFYASQLLGLDQH